MSLEFGFGTTNQQNAMTITTLTSLELNQDVSRAKKVARQGPLLRTNQPCLAMDH